MNDRHEALVRGNLAVMERCYHPDVNLGDPDGLIVRHHDESRRGVVEE
ncbi:hypothetical protein [Nonomuraea sp. NPDC050540]